MPDVSVLTLAGGRPGHLANMIRGLARQTRRPAELVVAVLQPQPYANLPRAPFPVRQIRRWRWGEAMNLSAARNAAAEKASGDRLAFLDVDCVPAPGFVADVLAAATPGRGVVMGEVGYLPAGALDHGLDYGRLERLAVRHSDRRGPPAEGLERCEDYRCFWSLNFAISRADWRRSGGFDERYQGYGGEDTDFARGLDAIGMGIWWMKGAKAYHQHHDHCMPPIQHLASVLRNSELFASKWGHRTMEHWLHAFRLMGLIEDGPDGLRIVREPEDADFALCRQTSDMAYANTRRVLDVLQGIDPAEAASPARARQVRADQSALLRGTGSWAAE